MSLASSCETWVTKCRSRSPVRTWQFPTQAVIYIQGPMGPVHPNWTGSRIFLLSKFKQEFNKIFMLKTTCPCFLAVSTCFSGSLSLIGELVDLLIIYMLHQRACMRWSQVTTIAFVQLFSTAYNQLFPGLCRPTLAADWIDLPGAAPPPIPAALFFAPASSPADPS